MNPDEEPDEEEYQGPLIIPSEYVNVFGAQPFEEQDEQKDGD